MRSNALLKWLTIPLVLLTIYGAVKLLGGPNEADTSSTDPSGAPRLTASESDALNVDADTAEDTVATLVGQVKQLRGELKSAVDENTKAEAENDRLRSRDSTLDQRIQAAIRAEREQWTREREGFGELEQRTDSALKDLANRLDALSKSSGTADLPVGFGLDDTPGMTRTDDEIHWTEPTIPGSKDNARKARSTVGSGFDEATSQTEKIAESAVSSLTRAARERVPGARIVPTYTAATNATLMGSVAMTALIGRVPVDGAVSDPFTFKVLVGADNLIANGIELPQLEGAVMSGTASGDWTLSCVRGQIHSVTFVFQDGTTVTTPKDDGDDGVGRSQSRRVLGTIGDEYGIPCISGQRRSNAQQYLTTQTLLTAAGAGAASLIDSDGGNYSFVRGGDGTTIGSVGISGKEAIERVLAGGVQEMSRWINRLYGQAYASVYVEPGAHVAVHLESPLHIDLDPQGRKVLYQSESTHAAGLD